MPGPPPLGLNIDRCISSIGDSRASRGISTRRSYVTHAVTLIFRTDFRTKERLIAVYSMIVSEAFLAEIVPILLGRKLTSIFLASVLLLMMNFEIT